VRRCLLSRSVVARRMCGARPPGRRQPDTVLPTTVTVIPSRARSFAERVPAESRRPSSYFVCFMVWCIEQWEVWCVITWWCVQGFMWCMEDASELAGTPASATTVAAAASRRIGFELIFIGAPPIAV